MQFWHLLTLPHKWTTCHAKLNKPDTNEMKWFTYMTSYKWKGKFRDRNWTEVGVTAQWQWSFCLGWWKILEIVVTVSLHCERNQCQWIARLNYQNTRQTMLYGSSHQKKKKKKARKQNIQSSLGQNEFQLTSKSRLIQEFLPLAYMRSTKEEADWPRQ